MKLISVLMSTYNEPVEWVKATLDSILNQTYKPYEVIIIVDNPENHVLVDYLLAFQKHNQIVKVYINERNIGLVKSLNKGLKLCKGELIARIDADDIALDRRFMCQVDAIESQNLDIVGTGYYCFFDNEIFENHEGVESAKACEKILKCSNILAHPSWMMKRDVPIRIGGYRDIDSCEDLDFLQRAVLAGFSIANVKEPLLMYRDNPHSISHNKRIEQMLIRDFICSFYRKHRISSYEDYKNYLKSQKFKRDLKKYSLFDEIYSKHNEKISYELIISGAAGCFIKQKCRHAYINYWRRKKGRQ